MNELSKEYHEKSYAVVKGFFPASVTQAYAAYLQDALKTKVAPTFARWNVDVFAPDCNAQVDALMKEQGSRLSDEDKHIMLGHFPLSVRLSDAIYPLAEYLGQSDLLKGLLGSQDLCLHMPPMMRFVPPGYMHAAVPAHQDISYNRHMSDFLTVWVPLVPITQTCGGLVLYEGSAEKHEMIDATQTAGQWLPPVSLGQWEKTQPVGLTLGDVVILSSYVVHASAPNLSDTIRVSMDLRLFSKQARSTKHYLDLTSMRLVEPQAA
jgi:ectoine hydroxylase-related dioxygenase (phytanoyl-CoA dioxygenase family)